MHRENNIRMFVSVSLVLLIVQCSAQIGHKYVDATQKELNRYLWRTTNSIWVNSFENRIKELVERGAEIDFNTPYGSIKPTPFLNASGMLENLKDKRHHSPEEIKAYELEAIKIVKYLAKKGANIHATSTSRKLNALHLAACGGRDKMIPVLIDLGLNINSTDSLGGTTLIHAIAAANLATVKSTVESGANINQCTPDGNSPLDWAQYYVKIKDKTFAKPYNNQEAIVEYMQSIGAKQGKNDFTGNLYN